MKIRYRRCAALDVHKSVDRVKLIMKFGDTYVVPIVERVVEDSIDDSDDDIQRNRRLEEGWSSGAEEVDFPYTGQREGDGQGTEVYFVDTYRSLGALTGYGPAAMAATPPLQNDLQVGANWTPRPSFRLSPTLRRPN